jgi:hypothetical protein
MESDALTPELIELATAYYTGGMTDDQRARLERLLEDDPAARSMYLRIADDTVTLSDVRLARSIVESSVEELCPSCVGTTMQRRIAARWKWVAATAAIAAGIVALATIEWSTGSAARPEGTNLSSAATSFARILNLSNVEWSGGSSFYREWQRIEQGDAMQFADGSVEVLYDNGVQFVVQGPADLTFLDATNVAARAGKLVARVSPEATGFKIVSPHAVVIDRGTSFGMTIDPDHQTDVVVYEGKVDLRLGESSAEPNRRLAAGEAMRIGRDGHLGRISSVANDAFLPPPSPRDSSADGAGRLIASVADNLKSSQTAKYYRVIKYGFREDCQAFVDRHHQWNGIDARGIPPFLAHADYVMTFNDDKVNADLRIAVTLVQPARLYVLLDNRAPVPTWLSKAFVDTGWDIGIDEGYDDVPEVKTAVGAGKSIENTCSVWMQDVPTPTTVLLGSLRDTKIESHPRDVEMAMYGILATPLAGDSAEASR